MRSNYSGGVSRPVDRIDMSSIGKQIREARIEKGLTQAQLSYQVGVNQTVVSDWEHDKYLPSNITSVALTLDIPIQNFISPEEDEVVKAINNNKLLSSDVRKALIVLYKKMLAADSLFNNKED